MHCTDNPTDRHALPRESPPCHTPKYATGGDAGAGAQRHARTGAGGRQQPEALRPAVDHITVTLPGEGPMRSRMNVLRLILPAALLAPAAIAQDAKRTPLTVIA